jgi:predicted amidohydrolase
VVTNREGSIVGRYRKIHIPGAFPLPGRGALVFEKLYFTPGDLGYPVMDLGFAKVGVQICSERNFPEGYRILALRGAEIIYTPTNLMRIGDVWTPDTWELVLRARAYENGCFVVGVNKTGHEGGLDFVGDSIVLSPKDGSVIARSTADTDDLLVVEIDLDDVTEARKRLPFMRDRQPWTYAPLIQ